MLSKKNLQNLQTDLTGSMKCAKKKNFIIVVGVWDTVTPNSRRHVKTTRI